MAGRRMSFWLAVGAVSVLSQFALELAAERFPNAGLARFVAFTHRGAS